MGQLGAARTPLADQKWLESASRTAESKSGFVTRGTFLAGTRPGPFSPGTWSQDTRRQLSALSRHARRLWRPRWWCNERARVTSREGD
jgi:hypothetical protein